jgi:hypothetical protein
MRTQSHAARSRAATKALRHVHPQSRLTTEELSRGSREAARQRSAADRKRAARRAVRTKGPRARSEAARKAARTRRQAR